MSLEHLNTRKSFGGWQKQYQHSSTTVNCTMRFSIYLPPQASQANPVPVLYWLSGLTCTDENFVEKANAKRIAAVMGIAIVATSNIHPSRRVGTDTNTDTAPVFGTWLL